MSESSYWMSFAKSIELSGRQIVIDYAMPLPINGLTTTSKFRVLINLAYNLTKKVKIIYDDFALMRGYLLSP